MIKTAAFLATFVSGSLLLINCGGDTPASRDGSVADAAQSASPDLLGGTTSMNPGNDLASPSSGSTDMAVVKSTDMGPAAGDLGTAGKKAFGDTCKVDGDCQSNMCRGFQMMKVLKCTKACTIATQAVDCPKPPSTGQCTPNGYCKF